MNKTRKVEVKTTLSVQSKEIIAAFTNPEMLREWWGVQETLIDKRPGGLYTLTWDIDDHGFGYVSTGIIKEYHPESTLIIENFVYLNPTIPILGPMSLTIKAKKKDTGAELYICQEGYQEGANWDWYFEAVTEAWPMVVDGLREYLEKNDKE